MASLRRKGPRCAHAGKREARRETGQEMSGGCDDCIFRGKIEEMSANAGDYAEGMEGLSHTSTISRSHLPDP